MIDNPTLQLTRPGVARACVEVNLLTDNPKSFWLDMGVRVVEVREFVIKRNITK